MRTAWFFGAVLDKFRPSEIYERRRSVFGRGRSGELGHHACFAENCAIRKEIAGLAGLKLLDLRNDLRRRDAVYIALRAAAGTRHEHQ